ncbi:low molecular weight protein arginine phosphatase [Kurthia huakuii]|uniref:low molecular weight protein arginine phosphatase n=1 Tax=Kurthia huakuii TaxID=1421019 RepID=UPI000495333D|nr:low molecular weight protein arginine phosphatase [Kurthia huakuii]MBM7698878.1 protein-tyrosine phosphatase [Kurthia huakuii]
MNIYFICTGNTCRSPMAAAILATKKMDDITVKSAGIFALPGGVMSTGTTQVLQEQDMWMPHETSTVTEENLAWADLILTMTVSHKNGLLQAYPHVADKTFSLKEYALDRDGDVSDPYGGSTAVYRKTFDELSQLIELAVQKWR